MEKIDDGKNVGLIKYLSPISVWALAFGCSVGWGAFVMPGTTFLPIAGPLPDWYDYRWSFNVHNRYELPLSYEQVPRNRWLI